MSVTMQQENKDKTEIINDLVLSLDANPELAVDSDDDVVPVPPTTTKAEALASMSIVQGYMIFYSSAFGAAAFDAASHLLDKFVALRFAAQLQPSLQDYFD